MKVNGKDYPIYYGQIKNVPNHQPEVNTTCSGYLGKKNMERFQSSPVDQPGRYPILLQPMSRWSNWFNETRCVLFNVLPGLVNKQKAMENGDLMVI